MAVFIITGYLGGGKTLVSVGLMRDAILQGRKVATNVDLWVENLLPWSKRNTTVYRLPDKLERSSFEIIGNGNPVSDDGLIDESNNGLIVLDEGGLALNSRDYREEGRQGFISWMIHSRKMGWDIAIIIQHIEHLDKQIREMFGEHVVRCSRLDKMRIPGIGWLLQAFGFKGTMGKLHKATCRYGQSAQAPKTWTKWYQGKDLYNAFNTRQVYNPFSGNGVFEYLTPWHVKGRHYSRWDEVKNGLKNFWKLHALAPVGRLSVFFCAFALGTWAHANYFSVDEERVAAAPEQVNQVPIEVKTIDEVETSEDFVESRIDPWDYAYISTFVGNVNHPQNGLYKFRAAGVSLQVPPEFAMIAVNPCSVILKSADKVYQVSCKKM